MHLASNATAKGEPVLLHTPLRPLARQPPPTLLINFGDPAAPELTPLAPVAPAARVADGGRVFICGLCSGFSVELAVWERSIGGRLSFSLPSQLSSLSCLGPAAGSRGPVRF